MKVLKDDREVESRGYYYLLDWNESDRWKTMFTLFNKERLCDLTIDEYTVLFKYATEKDLETLSTK